MQYIRGNFMKNEQINTRKVGEKDMTNTIDTIIKVVAFIYVFIDVFNPLIKQLITLTKAHTRNKNLVFAESIASQVVDFVSKTSDLTGDQRKKLATDTIWKRLKENGLADRFTEDQVSQLIEKAYTDLPKWWN